MIGVELLKKKSWKFVRYSLVLTHTKKSLCTFHQRARVCVYGTVYTCYKALFCCCLKNCLCVMEMWRETYLNMYNKSAFRRLFTITFIFMFYVSFLFNFMRIQLFLCSPKNCVLLLNVPLFCWQQQKNQNTHRLFHLLSPCNKYHTCVHIMSAQNCSINFDAFIKYDNITHTLTAICSDLFSNYRFSRREFCSDFFLCAYFVQKTYFTVLTWRSSVVTKKKKFAIEFNAQYFLIVFVSFHIESNWHT